MITKWQIYTLDDVRFMRTKDVINFLTVRTLCTAEPIFSDTPVTFLKKSVVTAGLFSIDDWLH